MSREDFRLCFIISFIIILAIALFAGDPDLIDSIGELLRAVAHSISAGSK